MYLAVVGLPRQKAEVKSVGQRRWRAAAEGGGGGGGWWRRRVAEAEGSRGWQRRRGLSMTLYPH